MKIPFHLQQSKGLLKIKRGPKIFYAPNSRKETHGSLTESNSPCLLVQHPRGSLQLLLEILRQLIQHEAGSASKNVGINIVDTLIHSKMLQIYVNLLSAAHLWVW